MTGRKGRRGSSRGRGQSGATTEPSSISSVASPRPEYVSTTVSAIEGPATSRPPSRDKSRPFYRLAFASANMIISKGYLIQHAKLPSEVKKLLDPIKCIPSSVKERVTFTRSTLF